MSKRTSPAGLPKLTDKPRSSKHRRFITPKAKMLTICIVVAGLLLATGTLAQLGLLRRTNSNLATTPATSTATAPALAASSVTSSAAITTTASFASNAPAKEYIYAGGRLLATEEPGDGSGSNLTNLALNKPATQSSTLPFGLPATNGAMSAVDGNTSGNYPDGTVTHTELGTEEYWQVDLGGIQSIQRIDLWNRTDCCAERLSDYYVIVSEQAITARELGAATSQPGVTTYYRQENAGTPTQIPVNRTGRFVRVQLAGSGRPLSLAEVQVWGTAATPPTTIGGSPVSVATGSDNLPRVLWRLNNGAAQIWTMSADGTSKTASVTHPPIAGWTPTAFTVGANNSPYLLWRNSDGRIGLWRLNTDNTYNSHSDYGPVSADWTPLTIASGGDSLPRVLWRNTDGRISLWTVQANWSLTGIEHGPYAGWQAVSLGIGYDNRPRIVWRYTDGRLSLWTCNPDGSQLTGYDYGPYTGWSVEAVTVGADNMARVMWKYTDGRISLWNVDGAGTFLPPASDHGPIGGWEARAMGTGGDSILRMLWQQTGGAGEVSFWTLNASNMVSSSTNYPSP